MGRLFGVSLRSAELTGAGERGRGRDLALGCKEEEGGPRGSPLEYWPNSKGQETARLGSEVLPETESISFAPVSSMIFVRPSERQHMGPSSQSRVKGSLEKGQLSKLPTKPHIP